jgi:hypothetical protein
MRISRKPGRFWTAQLVGWGLFGAVLTALVAPARGQVPLWDLALAYLCFCGAGMVGSSLLWFTIGRWALPHGVVRIIALAIPAALFAAIVWGVLNDALLFVLFDTPFPEPLSSKTLAGLFMLYVMMIGWLAIALTGHFVARAREAKEQAIASEAASAEARLLALQHQLDPHFLFNAINAIVELIDKTSSVLSTCSRVWRSCCAAAWRPRPPGRSSASSSSSSDTWRFRPCASMRICKSRRASRIR